MIKVTVLYPNGASRHFDVKYYTEKHIPMVRQLLGAACKKIELEKGIFGISPGSPPANSAICCLYFDSVEAFQQAFAPQSEAIMNDIPQYTNAEPVIQISEVIS